MSASTSDVATDGLADLSVEQEITADTVIVRVRGDLDHTTITRIDNQLHTATAVPTPPALIVLDLSRVTFLGSDGLSLLIANHRRCAMRGRKLYIVATTSAVLRPIALTGLDGILSIAPSVHEALGASMVKA